MLCPALIRVCAARVVLKKATQGELDETLSLDLPSPASVAALASALAADLPSHSELRLAYSRSLSDADVGALCKGLESNTFVHEISFLGCSWLTDESAKHLLALLKTNKTLAYVDLKETGVSRELRWQLREQLAPVQRALLRQGTPCAFDCTFMPWSARA